LTSFCRPKKQQKKTTSQHSSKYLLLFTEEIKYQARFGTA